MDRRSGEGGGGDDRLDLLFHALSDPTRRRILVRLTVGPARVSELARPFRMSLPAVSKHLKILERAHLLSRSVDGRIHRLALTPHTLNRIETWLDPFRAYWETQLTALGRDLERHRTSPGPARRSRRATGGAPPDGAPARPGGSGRARSAPAPRKRLDDASLARPTPPPMPCRRG